MNIPFFPSLCVRLALPAMVCLNAPACRVANDPRALADEFCHRYFIQLNQAGALELASGLAADKLRKEMALLKGGARTFAEGEREFHQHKPFIEYQLTSRTDQDHDRVLFLYQIDIVARRGNERMTCQLVLNMQRQDGRWTVNNYDLEY